MPKFIIRWDAGYGPITEVVTAKNMDEAENMAYQAWKEDAENNADYEALEYNYDNCTNYDHEFDGD